MAAILDSETVERLRRMPARSAFDEVRAAVFRSGPASSEDFVDVYEQLVEAQVLTWDQIEDFER